MNLKNDFPIFTNNSDLIYLDSAASTQKPSYVIDGIKYFLEHDYANIHRGVYSLSLRSEDIVRETREKVASFINTSPEEIIFTQNSTSACNLLAQSLAVSDLLKEGDQILLSPLEHHANIVPRQILAQNLGCKIDRMDLNEDLSLDMDLLADKIKNSRLVSITSVSSVTGEIINLASIQSMLADDTLFVVDASQAAPHIEIDVEKIGCDFLYFTGHKLMASTGVGILYGRKELLSNMIPSIGGGGSIDQVSKDAYSLTGSPDKFEPGTPNLVSIVSLLKALEYIETLGGTVEMGQIEAVAKELMYNGLIKLQNASKLNLLGSANIDNRVGLFSFTLPDDRNPHQLGQWMADRNICIRCGGQCAQPLHDEVGLGASCRASLYVYNTIDDVERFISVLSEYLG